MNPTEREETTSYAVDRINRDKNQDVYTALLLSFIYCNIRLNSLVTDHLSPKEGMWEKTQDFVGELYFFPLLGYAKKHGILTDERYKGLNDLREKRNKVAHESTPWRHPQKEQMRGFVKACEFAVKFLKETSG
jgi:hypothetical protein